MNPIPKSRIMKKGILLLLLLFCQAQYAQNGQSYFDEGKKLYEAKSYTEAIKQFDLAITAKFSTAELYILKANSSYYLKDRKSALDNYTKAIEADSKSARAYYNRGTMYEDDKKFDLALADFTSALNADPKYESALLERGQIYYGLHSDYPKAIADFEKYIAINPNNDLAYVLIGVCTAKLDSKPKTIAKAIEYFSKAIELNDKSSDYYYYRGYAYMDKEDYKKALADMNKAIELDAKNELAYFERSNIYYETQDFTKQIADLDKAIELNPKNGKYYYWRGYGKLFGLKDKDAACPDYTKAIELGYKKAEEMKSICSTKGRTIIITE